jgi:LPS export ABC transporter protein LptC
MNLNKFSLFTSIKNFLLYFGLSLFLIVVLVILNGCSDQSVKPKVISIKTKELPDQESFNTKVVFSDSGIVKAILRANHIAVYSSRNETLLDGGIVVDFFDREGNHTSVLTADKGRVDDLTQDLYAFGNVVARSDSGVVLKTEELKWVNSRRKIVTDKYVEITSPAEEIRGYGLESDQSLKDYVIFRVSGRIETKQ